MRVAYIHDGVIADLVIVPEGFELKDVRTPEFLAACVEVPDAAQVGWTWDGKAAAAPVVVQPVPAVRLATTYQLFGAFTDAQRAAYPGPIKAWDQRMFSARDTPWPETNEKIGRIATALGTSPKAWFDAALNPPAAPAAA